jgi:hypothetical protein
MRTPSTSTLTNLRYAHSDAPTHVLVPFLSRVRRWTTGSSTTKHCTAPDAVRPEFVCEPVSSWTPDQPYDLVTCVHGLHYVGDKLGALTRAASWLADAGLLVVDLDLASVRLAGGGPAGRPLVAALRRAGFSYDPRRRQVRVVGRRDVALPYAYVGADDRAGPNYTGQPAVNSVYRG